MSIRHFPPGFLIGTAQSAHQVEGGNVLSDWWQWERQPGTPCREPSGDACDFYHRWRQDLELVAGLGFNGFRFGLEWARIEPVEGEFSRAELDHYRAILLTCRQLGLAPVLTLHHFTLPAWLAAQGGFESPRFPALFERYCRRAAAVGDTSAYLATFNEPEGLGEGGWLLGVNPPGRRGDVDGFWRVSHSVLEAHRLGLAAVRAECDAPVGVTLALPDLQYEDGATPGETHVELAARVSDLFFEAARTDDWLGVQNYTRNRFGPDGPRGPHVTWDGGEAVETPETTQLGQEVYPASLGNAIRRARRATGGIPLLVTESGIATTDDAKRVRFLAGVLGEVSRAVAEGIDLRGFFHWSLLDNFEWSLGYRPRFGLVAVDRQTFARTPKPSAAWLGQVARTGALPPLRG